MQTVQSCFFYVYTSCNRTTLKHSSSFKSRTSLKKECESTHFSLSSASRPKAVFFQLHRFVPLGDPKKRKANGKRPDPQKSLFSHLLSLCFFAQFVERAPLSEKYREKTAPAGLLCRVARYSLLPNPPYKNTNPKQQWALPPFKSLRRFVVLNPPTKCKVIL